MENDVKITGKFYMNNGAVIEEEVVFDKDNDPKDVQDRIDDMKHRVQESFREGCDFQFTFGSTMFRGKDISAVTFMVAEE